MNGVNTKSGRPTAVSEAVVVLLEHALKLGCSVVEACRYADIGRTTYYAELERDKDFAWRMDRAKSNLIVKSKLIVFNAIVNEHNAKMAKWYLAHRDPDYK
jgi:hypothetical protein